MRHDFGDTPAAREARERKARALAKALAAAGYPAATVYELTDRGRRRMERAAGVRRCSDRTWDRVWVLLGGVEDGP
jgi:DNA-binding transcriptional regulator PaaX